MKEVPDAFLESQEVPQNEKHFEANIFENLSDEELESKVHHFLSEEIVNLSQKEAEIRITPLLIELAKRGVETRGMFSFSLPNNVTAEEIQSGQSSWAKVYRSLFSISKTAEYKESSQLQMMVRELENIIDQNPQMMGPVAMWDIAKDIMWRRDIPSHAKGSLMGSMTYTLTFFDTDRYEAELLKNLDFKNTENYAEVAHMLEALKQFWSSGHESYAEDRVPDFYLKALSKIKETPDANYLLSVRAREILSMLEQSDDFPSEARDVRPFELSKGMYASTQVGEGLTIAPEEVNGDIVEAVKKFDANEAQITHPQWLVDEALANGESWVRWHPPQNLLQENEQLFNQMHQYVSIPLDEKFAEFVHIGADKIDEMLFDYEYLVSRPVREMLQREFNFDLKELNLKEQFYFLNYLKHTTIAEAETMQNFTSLYGVTGMRTFLSLEQGDESLGDKIVAFGQHEDVARRVFAYYGELLDSADNAEQLVREFKHGGGDSGELIEQVRANILNRAQKDLVQAVQSNDVESIRGKLDTYTVGAKEYVALLQEVGTGNIENIKGGNLSNDDKTQMMTFLRSNYGTSYPHKEDKDFRKAVADSLEEHLDDPNTSFRILYDGAKIVSFNRFDTRTDTQTNREVTYFGSFNAAAPYSGVGGVMLERTIQEQLQGGHAMFAHCDPSQTISMKYIEDGFIATDIYNIAGKESFEIWRSDISSESVSSKQMSIQELLEFEASEDTGIIVREQKEDETYHEIKSGRALTRFFMYEDKKYLVFETLSDELRSSFQDVYTIDTIAAE